MEALNPSAPEPFQKGRNPANLYVKYCETVTCVFILTANSLLLSKEAGRQHLGKMINEFLITRLYPGNKNVLK